MSTTPIRNVRVPDDLWHAAQAEADSRNETVSAAIIRALRNYTRHTARHADGQPLDNHPQ